MRKIKKILGFSVSGSILPFAALAVKDVNDILNSVVGTLNIVIKIIFALATIVFGWGIVEYISAGGDEEKIKQGKQHILWGIIGMAVMFATWGLVKILAHYVGIDTGTSVTPPHF